MFSAQEGVQRQKPATLVPQMRQDTPQIGQAPQIGVSRIFLRSARLKRTGARNAQREARVIKPLMKRRRQFKTGLMLLARRVADVGQELRLNDMIAEALTNNREIADAGQRPSQASILPNPMFPPSCTSNGSPLSGAQLGVSPTSA